jgi:DMSO/TMAO reductase YedYZ molybdopterin-dependent catalytic subunit
MPVIRSLIMPGTPTRREFLQVALAALCRDPFAGARYLGTVSFDGADRYPPFHTLIGSGLDARRYLDPSALTDGTLVTPTDRFLIRTAAPDLLDSRETQAIRVSGLVRRPLSLSPRELDSRAQTAGPFLIECAGNSDRAGFGLMSAAIWSGVPVADILTKAHPAPAATLARISGFDRHSQASARSTPGASWIFTLSEIESSGALLATGMNGEPLRRSHGSPVRLVVPGWYGCTWIKWVDEITLLDDTPAATSQMREFAARTHQDGAPARARDYKPAAMDLAAFPVRIEKWRVQGDLVYRVVGIVWGGARATRRLQIRFNSSEPFRSFEICPPPATPLTWSLWTYEWRPPGRGSYDIVLRPGDPGIASRRLDWYFYVRRVWIDDV